VKKLVILGLSAATYVRDVFPEEAYIDYEIEGMCLKLLQHGGTCPAVAQFVVRLKNAFDVFSKKYVSFVDRCTKHFP
jgi:hypothetical protein